MRLLLFFNVLILTTSVHAIREGLECLCHELNEVSKDEFLLPEKYQHFGVPWKNFKRAKVFKSEKLNKNWDIVGRYKIRGIDDTVSGLVKFLKTNFCLFFAWGGSVRDLVLGRPPMDIDGAVTCNPHKLKRLCKYHYGNEKCRRPSPMSTKLTIGGEIDWRDDDSSVEPFDLAHWNSSFEVFGSHLEYSPNTLALYEEDDNVFIIDLSGNGVEDVCQNVVRIPTKRQYWTEWANENDENKLYRFWKLRARGSTPVDMEELDFLISEIKSRFSSETFEKFFCHSLLDGDYSQNTCKHGHITPSRKELIQHFVNVLKTDFGNSFYNDKFRDIVISMLQKQS